MTVNHFDVATPREWTLEVSYVLVRLGVDGGLTWLRYPQRVAQGGYQQQGRLVPCLWEERSGTLLLHLHVNSDRGTASPTQWKLSLPGWPRGLGHCFSKWVFRKCQFSSPSVWA